MKLLPHLTPRIGTRSYPHDLSRQAIEARREQTVYPFKKTVIFFTLAPVLPGIFLSLYLAAMGIFSSAENTAVTDGVFGTLGLVIASAILGLILYGVPALILSIIYACFELHRCFKHIAITGLAGGLTALIWSHLVPLDMKPAVIFASGAVSSLLTAIYALPKESR